MTEQAKFDATQLTLGEIAFVEEYSGQPLNALSNDDAPKGRVLAALACVITRKTNPKFTIASAEKLTVSQATELINGATDETDPKD